jgi:hypothetical protein
MFWFFHFGLVCCSNSVPGRIEIVLHILMIAGVEFLVFDLHLSQDIFELC